MSQIKKLTLFLQHAKFLVIIFAFIFLSSTHLFAQEATGGDEVYEIEIDGKTYRVHAFKTVGNHTFVANQNLNGDILIVAGGGSGGGANPGGGGGAGGLVYLDNYLLSQQSYLITVGKGGINDGSNHGINGDNSQFNYITAYGGGGGAYCCYYDGSSGGSGGGAGSYLNRKKYGGSGYLNQGNKGGDATSSNSGYAAGGGGGAGAAGQNGTNDSQSNGGDGVDYSHIFGTNIGDNGWFAGGGGGGRYPNSPAGLGGQGGGGNGNVNGVNQSTSGLNGTGGGGGGGHPGADGGSGIVIIRYEISQFNLNINNGDVDITPTKTSPELTISGTIDYPDDGDATSVAVSATIGGVSRNINVPVSTNMTWQLSWSHNELSEGEYSNIEFTATSNSSTPEETTSTYTGKIIIDKTPPTCGNWTPAESPWKISGGEYFTLTSSSDIGGSGLATTSASLSCSTGPLHGDTCSVTIFDKAGNDQICPSPINRVDIFAPALTVTPAITGWQGDKQDIIVLSEDNETSLARIAYAWDLNTLGADCSGGISISSGDNLRLTISGGANPLYVCSIDLAGNVSTFTNIYQYIPPVFSSPNLQKQVTPTNLYWNIQSVSETQSYLEVKGFFPKTTGTYNYSLEYIIPTINKSYTQALRTSPFVETHFTFLIPTSDFRASKDNHTFSGPQKLKITDLDQMEATTIDHNLSFFFPIYQTNHRRDFNYFIFASDNRVNELGK